VVPICHSDSFIIPTNISLSLSYLSPFFFSRVRLKELLRNDRGCSAEKQTPKTSEHGRRKEKKRRRERKINAFLVLALFSLKLNGPATCGALKKRWMEKHRAQKKKAETFMS
jgi:hypothetical protein